MKKYKDLDIDEKEEIRKNGQRPVSCDKCGYEWIMDSRELLKILSEKKDPCPWCSREAEKYIPKCPTCQSPDVKKLTNTQKAVSAGMFGLFSGRVKKTFHCNGCGYEW
jgi:primosomal protein N'